ncbi:hypothetical protein EGH24_03530 [Halonotius terrestris]|uniref:DUF7123 domain-containing protein n=1 Tax=Halonotius terrestris TaxID=2487750 RepID=A0A8J8PCM2_9EURY|nr:hypothetical protein [Halonotius terrestris]TQQ82538.1 hypothetical protein EGH24_03530 [Halonotius terrestris]
MSTSHHSPADDTRTARDKPSDKSDETADKESTATKQQRLAAYLRERADDGEVYFKSKFIADDVDLSAKEIGALILKLQDSVADLSIERWSYTGATTWRVERTN